MPQLRGGIEATVFYCIAYGLVFLLGMVGNTFVIVALIRNPTLRNVTNYFIASLAAADLLICIFVVPLTLMNNIIVEWLFGDFVCKAQVWLSGTCVCASVYILVAVSADRFMAICYPIRYSVWSGHASILGAIAAVWAAAGIAFVPWYIYYGTVEYHIHQRIENVTIFNVSDVANITNSTLPLCMAHWPSRFVEIMVYIVLNIVIAFLIPLVAICILYVLIFLVIFNRKSIAVDNQATARETRIRVRVTHMMLAVVVTFVICWVPFYSLFAFILYKGRNYNSPAIDIVRPVFQWLSLANSCLNPILYASFSAKFRLAFLEIIVLPCQRRASTFRRFAQTTVRRISDKRTISISSKTSKASLSQVGMGKFRQRQNRRLMPQTSLEPPNRATGENAQPLMMRSFSNYTIINEKYVDDGTGVSIPLFEKISVV